MRQGAIKSAIPNLGGKEKSDFASKKKLLSCMLDKLWESKNLLFVLQEYLIGSQLDTSSVEAYVELHIEQGPLLENEQKEVGIVTGIFGAALVHVQFNGSGGHGGGMPMESR